MHRTNRIIIGHYLVAINLQIETLYSRITISWSSSVSKEFASHELGLGFENARIVTFGLFDTDPSSNAQQLRRNMRAVRTGHLTLLLAHGHMCFHAGSRRVKTEALYHSRCGTKIPSLLKYRVMVKLIRQSDTFYSREEPTIQETLHPQ